MNKKTKRLLFLLVLSSNLVLTGCWDRIELENRAFVMAVGIDKYDPEKVKVPDKFKVEKNENNKLKMTYLLPKFSAVKQGEEGKNSRQLLTSVGKTPYETTRQLTVRGDSQPFFQHMKAAVLGVDIIKDSDSFLEILDGLERQDEISRKLHIFIAEDQASDILQVESMLKPLSYKLQGMSRGNVGTNLFIPRTLEETISSTVQGATLIPKITASKTEIKVAGSAVLKNSKFIGWLGAEETKAVAFLTQDAKQDIIQIEYEGIDIPYIIKAIKVKRTSKVEDGKIHVDINLNIRGNIQQYKVRKEPRFIDKKLLDDLEKIIDKTITLELNKTIDKLQNEMNADVIDIGEYLQGHKPDIWKQVEKDWNEVFPKVKVNVRVDAYIDKTGSIK